MRYNKEQKSEWIAEWQESGMSISKFCEDKPFDKSSFYNWRKESQDSGEKAGKNNFITIDPLVGNMPYLSIVYPSGVRVDIHVPMQVDDVRKLAGC